MDHIIEVTGLKKSYGAVQAVKGIDFYVEAGKIFAHAAMSVYQEEEMERLKAQMRILAAGKGMKIRGQ